MLLSVTSLLSSVFLLLFLSCYFNWGNGDDLRCLLFTLNAASIHGSPKLYLIWKAYWNLASQEMTRSNFTLELDAANATWLSNDVALLSTKTGELLLLTLVFDGRWVIFILSFSFVKGYRSL